jgi:hypothetical protein
VVSIHSLADGFYGPGAEAIGFPNPGWSHRSDSNRSRHDTNVLHQPPCYGAWRMTSGTIQTPRGAHSLAGRPGNLTGCIIRVGGRRRARTPDHLWSHLVSNERRGLPRFTFHLAESGCARCPGLTAPSVFKTAPGTFPVHSPSWRTGGALEAHTLSGANRFPSGAGHLTDYPS